MRTRHVFFFRGRWKERHVNPFVFVGKEGLVSPIDRALFRPVVHCLHPLLRFVFVAVHVYRCIFCAHRGARPTPVVFLAALFPC